MKVNNIILGVTGGIAAYKSVELCRRLIEMQFNVRVVMTASAEQFVTPLTFQAASGVPVSTELFDLEAEAAMGHIELARWADIILIAPATADFMARMAHGLANDLLSTLCLASRAKLVLAPAMNQNMWSAKATQENCLKLKERDVTIWGPAEGQQACGDVGLGRMLEPQDLLEHLKQMTSKEQFLKGQKWMITAGPTREAIDPVRFLSNHSSGKMGYAIAKAAAEHGAEVTVVSGPVICDIPSGINVIHVITAEEMLAQVLTHVESQTVFVACAAVADYRPVIAEKQKIKKTNDKISIEFIKNPDILQKVANLKVRPICVGFAAETQDVEKYAMEKLKRKNLDMICANNVSKSDIGFDANENALQLFFRDGSTKDLGKSCKHAISRQLISIINEQLVKSS